MDPAGSEAGFLLAEVLVSTLTVDTGQGEGRRRQDQLRQFLRAAVLRHFGSPRSRETPPPTPGARWPHRVSAPGSAQPGSTEARRLHRKPHGVWVCVETTPTTTRVLHDEHELLPRDARDDQHRQLTTASRQPVRPRHARVAHRRHHAALQRQQCLQPVVHQPRGRRSSRATPRRTGSRFLLPQYLFDIPTGGWHVVPRRCARQAAAIRRRHVEL
jgi:hypothetical protein